MIRLSSQTQQPLALRVVEATALLGIGADELRRLLHAGEIAGYRTTGGHWRVSADGLRAYVARRCSEEQADRGDRAPMLGSANKSRARR